MRLYKLPGALQFHDLKWKIIHRVHPKHRYHVIKPRSLEPGYHDPDIQIQAAAFDTLSEFAESNLMGDGIDGTCWTQSDFDYYDDPDTWGKESFYEQVEREKKVIELRNWWVVDRKNREQVEEAMWSTLEIDVPNEWGDHWILNSAYDDTPEKEEYRQRADRLHEIEEQWKKEDNRKMHELVDLLPFLWY